MLMERWHGPWFDEDQCINGDATTTDNHDCIKDGGGGGRGEKKAARWGLDQDRVETGQQVEELKLYVKSERTGTAAVVAVEWDCRVALGSRREGLRCQWVGRDELEERGKNSVESGTEGMGSKREGRIALSVGRKG